MNRRAFIVSGFIALPLLAAGCQTTQGGASEPAFADLAGVYSGTQVRGDGSSRPMRITVAADGSYTWVSNGETITDGRLSRSGGGLRYTNTAGSRGTVTASQNQLIFQNTFTGNNYTVTVNR
ncbi:hypothetical protein [Roseicyclus marinus]|uniref:hypothetical protein n=1 Tax=Roseicyclus marinus TaxID=2161673 RepID=UPI00240F8F36|nr:hypothetical protein [Roseicyclus marinus]MDG3041014.1 hypothetical protein [Roseicyclus marinus]